MVAPSGTVKDHYILQMLLTCLLTYLFFYSKRTFLNSSTLAGILETFSRDVALDPADRNFAKLEC